jgi:aminoglycoside 3-N-acetyltransferase
MRTYHRDDLLGALRSVGGAEGGIMLVHSSLMALGLLEGYRPTDLARGVYDVLREVVGDGGTLVVPAFAWDFCKGLTYDPATTPSQGMGVLSEYVRTLPEARRSPHPMQSVAAVGPQAEAICAGDTLSSFAPGGPFAVLLSLGARGLLLGVPIQSFSLVHLVEERMRVPYRYWKDFTAPYGSLESAELRTYRMYVRDLALDPRLTLDPIEDVMAGRGQVATSQCGSGWIKGFTLNAFVAATEENLARDPYSLLQNRPAEGAK